jgi:hypothetical protein
MYLLCCTALYCSVDPRALASGKAKSSGCAPSLSVFEAGDEFPVSQQMQLCGSEQHTLPRYHSILHPSGNRWASGNRGRHPPRKEESSITVGMSQAVPFAHGGYYELCTKYEYAFRACREAWSSRWRTRANKTIPTPPQQNQDERAPMVSGGEKRK